MTTTFDLHIENIEGEEYQVTPLEPFWTLDFEDEEKLKKWLIKKY